MGDEERRARAALRRQRMTIRRATLGDESSDLEGTPEDRIALVVELTRAAWAMTGKPRPQSGMARIDIINRIAVPFDEAVAAGNTIEVAGRRIPVIGRGALLVSKIRAGRPQDLADVDALRRLKESGSD